MSNINLESMPVDVMSIIAQNSNVVDLMSMKMTTRTLNQKISPFVEGNYVYMFKGFGFRSETFINKSGQSVVEFMSGIPEIEFHRGGVMSVYSMLNVEEETDIISDISSFEYSSVKFYNFKRAVGGKFIVGSKTIEMINCEMNPVVIVKENTEVDYIFSNCVITRDIMKPVLKRNVLEGKIQFHGCVFDSNAFDFAFGEHSEIHFEKCDLDNNKIDDLLDGKRFHSLDLIECENVSIIPRIVVRFLKFCSYFDERFEMLMKKHDTRKCTILQPEFD